MSVTEAAFEDGIASWLVEHGGYGQVKIGNVGDASRDFDAEAGVDTADLFVFIGATQGERRARLVDSAYEGDPNRAIRRVNVGWGLFGVLEFGLRPCWYW
ncbi:MAG: hypothetical protein KTV16_11750 [Acidimicrobiia bacterium]|nr:hypothetical protein [Acidimicrobiia bacterium]MCY4458296.1 hypothetical protein [Acidimicrobiaceae bacterium]